MVAVDTILLEEDIMDKKIKNIGLLGCSKIAPFSMINPVKELDDICVYGVAARDVERAKEYAIKYQIPKYYKDYDELISSEDIDIVYIALINSEHMKWAIKSAECGKHVLVEKPACLDANELSELEKVCVKNKVYCLEAVMVQHHPWEAEIKRIIDEKKYGKLNKIKTVMYNKFSKDDDKNYRLHPKYGGGILFDEGPYWLQFLQYIVGLDYESYAGESDFDGPHGCDFSFNAVLKLQNGVEADFKCSFGGPVQASHRLEFDHAVVTVKNLFRCCYGKFKIKIQINDLVTGEKSIIPFQPKCYYIDQLMFLSQVIDGNQENIPLKQTYDRISLINKLYDSAKLSKKEC